MISKQRCERFVQTPGLDAVVTINPDIAFRELDGEMVILNLQTGIYFGLDAVGARAWTLIRDLGSLAAVSAALGARSTTSTSSCRENSSAKLAPPA